MRKNNKKNKNKKIIPIIIVLIIISLIGVISFKEYQKNIEEEKMEKLKNDINNHYNKFVKTNKETKLYVLNENKFTEVGKIAKEQELELIEKEINYEDEYLKLATFDKEYYIYYKDIDKIDSLKELNERHKSYIPFNKNIITNNVTNFYDEEDNLIYTLNSSFNLQVIVNKEDIYGVDFNNQLLYIKKEDVKEVIDYKNTDKTNTKGIAVLNYHFFYDAEDPEDICNQGICLSIQKLKQHLDYFKENNILTLKMKELEMYIDGQIQLPKSVVMTIDDGWRAKIGTNLISEYKMNATVFVISHEYEAKYYRNEYIETHSHGHDLHNPGVCPGGQGGAIKCLDKTKLLEDLKKSREVVNNTTYFCYPFYEYNEYSISVLKEAGFTMAFGGSWEDGKTKAQPGMNKFKIPRYIIMNYTSVNDIKSYVG